MNIHCNQVQEKNQKVSKIPAPWIGFDLGYQVPHGFGTGDQNK